jgi:hypothetical protein
MKVMIEYVTEKEDEEKNGDKLKGKERNDDDDDDDGQTDRGREVNGI